MTNRSTAQSIGLYTDALLRWLKAGHDYPGLANPEPVASDYGLCEWEGLAVKKRVVGDFERTA